MVKLYVHRNGSIFFQTRQGTKFIHDVLYVPFLPCNLLSMAQMMSKGYSYFESKDSLIVKVEIVDKMFPLDRKFDSANFASTDESWLWHKRYGHFNYATLKYTHEKVLTKDLPKMSLSKKVCESCQMGTVHKKAFPKNATLRATKKLELVHIDVCGPCKHHL